MSEVLEDRLYIVSRFWEKHFLTLVSVIWNVLRELKADIGQNSNLVQMHTCDDLVKCPHAAPSYFFSQKTEPGMC